MLRTLRMCVDWALCTRTAPMVLCASLTNAQDDLKSLEAACRVLLYVANDSSHLDTLISEGAVEALNRLRCLQGVPGVQ